MTDKHQKEYHTDYGTLFKKSDKWFIKPKDYSLEDAHPIHPSSITINEPNDDIAYGTFKFYVDEYKTAHLSDSLNYNLNALQDFRMEYITLMVLSAFFKENSTHKAYAYIQTRLEHLANLLHTTTLAVRNDINDIKVEYKVLKFVRNLFPKKSKLKVVHYIDAQMEFLIDQHFLDSKD